MNIYLKNFLRFCIIVLLQVLILKRITLIWWTNPHTFPAFIPDVYPLFILLLPFEISVWALLLLGFTLGITIDTFMNTGGIHAFAMVLVAYLRTNVLNALMPRNLNEYVNQQPTIKTMGWMPFLVYSAFLIFIHHSVFYILEMWNVGNLNILLIKIAVSTITTMLFILIYILLFTRQNVAKL